MIVLHAVGCLVDERVRDGPLDKRWALTRDSLLEVASRARVTLRLTIGRCGGFLLRCGFLRNACLLKTCLLGCCRIELVRVHAHSFGRFGSVCTLG